MMDFIQIVDRIFKNKDLYYEVTDEDKIASFFKINRKFGKEFPDISRKFNHKNIDKASAIDAWFNFFKSQYGIPKWYWDPKDKKKVTKASKKSNYEIIRQREDLKDFEIDYLEKYYEEDLKNEMRKLSKFEQ